jgi:hypothetical protein
MLSTVLLFIVGVVFVCRGSMAASLVLTEAAKGSTLGGEKGQLGSQLDGGIAMDDGQTMMGETELHTIMSEGGSLEDTLRSNSQTGSSIADKELSAKRLMIIRILNDIIEEARSKAAPAVHLRSLATKRANARKCYFHAVNCW